MSPLENGIHRRDFIRIGSAAAALLAVGADLAALPAKVAEEVPLASVGFWSAASHVGRRSRSSRTPYLIEAQSRTAGDPSFISAAAARIAVFGFWRPIEARQRPAALVLDVICETSEGRLPFHAWSFHRNAAAHASRGQRLSFTTSIDPLATLDLIVRRDATSQQVSLTVNPAENAIALRRGYYFLALHESDDEPKIDWTLVRLREGSIAGALDQDGDGLLVTDVGFGEVQPVPFSYLVVLIDLPRAEAEQPDATHQG